MTEWSLVYFQDKPFNITIIQVYAPTSNAEEAEVEWFYEDLQDLLELIPKKYVLFIIGDWNAKVGSQEMPGITGKFGLGVQNETEQKLTIVLPREHTGHSKHPLPTTHETTLHMDVTRWSIPKSDWLCSLQPKMEKLYTVSKNKTWSWLLLRSWTLYCQIQTEIEVGKTTRPFRHDLNHIPYNYTVEVTNRFNGLDLIDRLPKELWMEVHDIGQETGIKTIPKKKKCRKAKWLFEEALQIAKRRREAKEKSKDIPIWMQSSKE